MNTLPIEKNWTGDGYVGNPLLLKQVKRTESVALYSRVRNGKIESYEVFTIRKRLKGQPLPGGLFEKEDREVYPSANQFGKIAWACQTLDRANEKFDELVSGPSVEINNNDEDNNDHSEIETPVVSETPKKERVKKTVSFPIPDTEFSIGDYASSLGVSYAEVFLWSKQELVNGTIKLLRKERRNGSRKPTNVYAKS